MNKIDFLIVGAGFSGATLANLIANKLGKNVMVIERKNYIGGHASDYYNDHDVLVHRHGPHYFRTNSVTVLNYLKKYAKWKRVKYVVKAFIDGDYYPIPINRNSLNMLYKVNLKNEKEALFFIDSIRKKIKYPKNFKEEIISRMGLDIYEKFFKNYTRKQWGIDPSKIDSSVAKRIPIRTSTDDSYINEKYQVMPEGGYSKLINNMLQHKKITLKLNTNYKSIAKTIKYKYLIYTGCIDEFFNHKYGKLPYRSLYFRHTTYKKRFFQNWVQVNYPNIYKFTRIVEVKHITGQKSQYTTIVKEYPRSKGQPYYPYMTKRGLSKYTLYKQEAKKLKNVYFVGRLAEYKYINMDQAIENAMNLYTTKISKLKF